MQKSVFKSEKKSVKKGVFIVSVLLSARVERVSVSRLRDFFLPGSKKMGGVHLFFPQ